MRNSVCHLKHSCGCRWNGEQVCRRAIMHGLLKIRRSLERFCLYNFVKHMKGELSFTIMHLGKTNLLYAMPISRPNAADMMRGSLSHLGYHRNIYWCWRAPPNWRRKRQIASRAEKISMARACISFVLLSWDIDMCERIYRKHYNIPYV